MNGKPEFHVRTIRLRAGMASVTIVVAEALGARGPLEARVICDGAHVGTWSGFSPAPAHAWDSDDTMAALIGFIALRPGDTDPEYFEAYTGPMLAFAEAHAEALAMAAEARFGARS